jgi:hypothetical protein
MLQQVAPRAAELDPRVTDLGKELEQVRHDIVGAGGGVGAGGSVETTDS